MLNTKKPKEKPEFNSRQLFKMEQLFKSYQFLKLRYIQVMDNMEELNCFCTLFRSQVFDFQFLKTGLISEAAKLVPSNKRTKDHYFNRTLSCKLIFDEMVKNPNMTFEEFVVVLKKYGSTIIITKEEHSRFKKDAQGMYLKTYKDYESRGINILGLIEYSKSLGH